MKAINVLLSVLISLAIGLSVFEAGLRLIGRGPDTKINQPDAALGWSKRTDFTFERKSAEFDVTLHTNEFGLRDDSMTSKAKPDGTFRVLCLGDSFTLGYTVSRDNLFVDLIERHWQAEGRKVDVINAGTEGYSTDQEAAWLMHEGAAYQPDVVLLFPYENDIWWNGQSTYLDNAKPRFTPEGQLEQEQLELASEGLLAGTAIGRLLKSRPSATFLTVGERQLLADFAPLLIDTAPGMEDAMAHTRGALTALKQTCADLGAQLVMVPIPSHSAVSPEYKKTFDKYLAGFEPEEWSANRPVDFFLAEAAALGIEALDPRASLIAANAQEAVYFQPDFHLNAAGNSVLADFLTVELDKLGLFPETHAAQHAATAIAASDRPQEDESLPGWLFLYLALWTLLGLSFVATYRDENGPLAFLKVGVMLAVIFSIALGAQAGSAYLPSQYASGVALAFILGILGFVLFKLGHRIATIAELIQAFVLRGHWYLMPLVVVLLTVGSLLVVAASSPLVAPFIYTLF